MKCKAYPLTKLPHPLLSLLTAKHHHRSRRALFPSLLLLTVSPTHGKHPFRLSFVSPPHRKAAPFMSLSSITGSQQSSTLPLSRLSWQTLTSLCASFLMLSFINLFCFFTASLWKADKLHSRTHVALPPVEAASSRRHVISCSSTALVAILTFNCGLAPVPVQAEDMSNGQDEKEEGVIGAIKSLFDPNEKTKSGKVLPKAYLKSARELVKTLRESLKEDPKDIANFRRNADSAKESIRDYLSNWRGQKTVAGEESYVELEKAIRSLASFYSKAGPSAPLPGEVKSEILNDLDTAEKFL